MGCNIGTIYVGIGDYIFRLHLIGLLFYHCNIIIVVVAIGVCDTFRMRND